MAVFILGLVLSAALIGNAQQMVNITDCDISAIQSAANAGQMSPSGAVPVAEGSNVTYTCNNGYEAVTEDGERVSELYTICLPDGIWSNFSASCQDLNECAAVGEDCHFCTNTKGSFSCTCRTGYQPNILQDHCIDVDECSRYNHDCHPCKNIAGSFVCHCQEHYQLDPFQNISCVESCGAPVGLDKAPSTLSFHSSSRARNYYPVNVKLQFMCTPGYNLQGSSSIVCQSDNELQRSWSWSASIPTCVQPSSSSSNNTTIIAVVVSVVGTFALIFIILSVYVIQSKKGMHREMERKRSLVSLRVQEARERHRRESELQGLQTGEVIANEMADGPGGLTVRDDMNSRVQSTLMPLEKNFAVDGPSPMMTLMDDTEAKSPSSDTTELNEETAEAKEETKDKNIDTKGEEAEDEGIRVEEGRDNVEPVAEANRGENVPKVVIEPSMEKTEPSAENE